MDGLLLEMVYRGLLWCSLRIWFNGFYEHWLNWFWFNLLMIRTYFRENLNHFVFNISDSLFCFVKPRDDTHFSEFERDFI